MRTWELMPSWPIVDVESRLGRSFSLPSQVRKTQSQGCKEFGGGVKWGQSRVGCYMTFGVKHRVEIVHLSHAESDLSQRQSIFSMILQPILYSPNNHNNNNNIIPFLLHHNAHRAVSLARSAILERSSLRRRLP